LGRPARAQQLQRDPALVQAIGTRRQPDLAHAAFAEQAIEAVGPTSVPGCAPGAGAPAVRVRKVVVPSSSAMSASEFGRSAPGSSSRSSRRRSARRLGGDVEQRIEQRGQALPALGFHGVPDLARGRQSPVA
jgi:hypothetical protein